MLFLLLLQPMGADATGAHVLLWLADLSEMQQTDWQGKAMFFKGHVDYGLNSYVLFASHQSQWWLTAYAVYFPTVTLSDISELMRTNAKKTVLLGHYSALFIIACLWPLAKKSAMPWLEIVAQGNNYEGEYGATLTMRHYSQPRLWWRKIGPEMSIPNGRDLYTAFKSMKLPRFVIDGAYNFASWHPYLASGPRFFSYCGPKEWTIKQSFLAMFGEHEAMAEHMDHDYAISRSMLYEVAKIYQSDYVEGPWLTKGDRQRLNYQRKGRL